MVLRHSLPLLMLVSVTVSAQDARTWRITDAPAEIRPLVAHANLVIAELQDSVLKELSHSLAEGGADVAIRSTHFDVRLLRHRLRREGIAVGRTSDRLRNQANRPPPWAQEMVTKWAGRKATEVDGYVVDLGDRIGLMRPVAEHELCTDCHGALGRLSPRVREVLSQLYPADRALGFHEGEIRGWYWVEMPKPR